MITTKPRIEYIDALKGFAIFLVLWGHCIQVYQKDIEAFFMNNSAAAFIYSFHMPLFFVVSGFFFLSSLKLNLRTFLGKKVLQLLLPCFVWAILFAGIDGAKDILSGRPVDYSAYLLGIIHPMHWPFWFLKELFLSYVLTWIAYRLFKNDWLVLAIGLLFLLFVLFDITFNTQRSLWPFFMLGICLKKNYAFIQKHAKALLFGAIIVFAVCLCFWKMDYTFYKIHFLALYNIRTGLLSLDSLAVGSFRWLIGAAGSLVFFLLFALTYRNNRFFASLTKVGTATLGIYIIQSFILEKEFFYRIIDSNLVAINVQLYSWLIAPVLATIVLLVCYYLTKWINTNTYTGLFLLGTTR